jgi:pentatricopeptide repeat domain-containing protein 1
MQEAIRVLDTMQDSGYRPTQVSYNAAMSALTKNGQWQQAIDMFDRIFRDGDSSSGLQADSFSYGAVLSACAKGRSWVRAFALFEEMKAAGVKPNEFHYSSLMTACERGQQPRKAIEAFEEMQAEFSKVLHKLTTCRKCTMALTSSICGSSR